MNDENKNENPFEDFDPYDCLMELTRQNAILAQEMQMIKTNQQQLAYAYNEINNRINAQGRLIAIIQNRIFKHSFGDVNEKENGRPTR